MGNTDNEKEVASLKDEVAKLANKEGLTEEDKATLESLAGRLDKLENAVNETTELMKEHKEAEEKSEEERLVEEAKEKTLKELDELKSESRTKSRLPFTLIMAGIIILVVLIFRIISDTKSTVNTRSEATGSVTVTVDEEGNTVDSIQNPSTDK